MSSNLAIGRLLFVTFLNPCSQYESPISPFSGSLSSNFFPTGPSTTASASFSFWNKKGKSKTMNSLIAPATNPGTTAVISTVPP
jgi:hypothetical protein